MKRFASNRFLTSLFLTLLAHSIAAQEVPDSEKPIKVNTTLMNVPLVISDRSGRRISGIRKEDISVFSGGQKLNVEFFADSGEPVNYAIVIDASSSTGEIRSPIVSAARKLIDTFSEVDSGMVLRFDNRVKVVQPFTNDKRKIRSAVSGMDVDGGIGLMNESIVFLLREHFKDIKGRKAIIVLTDAGEIKQESKNEALKELSLSSVPLYPIIYQTLSIHDLVTLSGDKKGGEELRKLKAISINDLIKYPPFDFLDQIAKTSGGKLLFADDGNFESSFLNIADELRKQYVVGFYVDADSNPDTREITIKVDRPGVVVRTKRSIKVAAQ